jgi:hypothetical protein
VSVVQTFAVAMVGGVTGSACGAGILMWARHRERELDLEERAQDEMAAEANTFAGAAAAAQGLLTAAKWEGLRRDRDDLFHRMMERHDEIAERLPRIHTAFGSSSAATSAAVRVNEELEACLRHLYGVYDAIQRRRGCRRRVGRPGGGGAGALGLADGLRRRRPGRAARQRQQSRAHLSILGA